MQYFLSLLIGLLSFVVLPHVSPTYADTRCRPCSCEQEFGTCSCYAAPNCGVQFDNCYYGVNDRSCEPYSTECTSGATRCCTSGSWNGEQNCINGYWGSCNVCDTNQCRDGSCVVAECSEGERQCCNLPLGGTGIQICDGTNWGTCLACAYDNGYCSGGICKCTSDCSCASNTCTGSTCDDGCGGTCAGTKTCCSNEGQACGSGCCYGLSCVNGTCRNCGYIGDPVCSRPPLCTEGVPINGICSKQCPVSPRSCIEYPSGSGQYGIYECPNYVRGAKISTCGLGCNASQTDCNEPGYCENECDTARCPVPQMRIYCWTDRTKTVEIPAYFDRTPPIVPICCNNLTSCNGTNCGAATQPTPFCHPVTNVCHADTLVPPCKDQYPSAPYEWWDNCGGISCLADPCTAPTTAPGDPICVPDCSCAANTCIGQTCTDPRCGGICNGSRDCSVTLTATAKYFTTAPVNCSTVTNPANGSYLYPVTFTMNGSPTYLAPKTLSSGTSVSWPGIQVGTYSIVSAPPPSPEYQYAMTCWTKSDGTNAQASSITFYPTEIGVTGNFFVAFGPPGPWHQTQEGDVYSGGTLQTFVPSTAANRYYTLAGAGGTRGVITANTLSVLPTPDWRISGHSNPTQNYYASYLRKAATTTKTPLNPGTVSSFPASSTVYTTTGDLTFGNGSTITVSDGISVVYLVDGNVTISQSLALANPNTSFLAIIASGTISVASTITGSSANPGLDGVFLAGTFRDLEQTPPASPHTPLFVRGLVAANTVTLLRDNADRSVPSDTFIYNPALPFTMPEWMKDLYYEWREVAP